MSRIDILNQFGLKPKYASEEEKVKAVKEDGNSIEYIQNPSEALQLEAVKQNGYFIQYIHNPSEAVQLEAVKQDGNHIQYIHNPSEAVQLEAIKTLTYNYVDLITNEKALLEFCKRIVVEQVLNV